MIQINSKLRTRKLFLSLLVGASRPDGGKLTSVRATAETAQRRHAHDDDTGWNDFGAYSGGGAALGHPTPNIDRSPRKVRPSRTGTVKQAVRRAGLRLLLGAFQSVRRSPLSSLRATRMP